MNSKLLIGPKDIKPSFKGWTVTGVLNPAAVRLPNKKIMLMARVAEMGKHQKQGLHCPIVVSEGKYEVNYENIHKDRILKKGKNIVYLKDGTCRLPTISHLRRIILDESGYNIEEIDKKQTFTGNPLSSDYGVEDPRITKIGNIYYMTYVGVSTSEGVSTYLASSRDLKKWKRLGLIFREQNKDVVLFSEKIKNRYVALNRPESLFEFSKPSIWISYSPDLFYWGRDKNLIRTREKSWEDERIGSGPPPLKTKEGWLLIYHGVHNKKNTSVYSAGAILLDLKDPEKIIARSSKKKPLLKPTKKFEKTGFINNVIFPTGLVRDGEDLLLYSGGGDSIISVRRLKLNSLLKSLEYYH